MNSMLVRLLLVFLFVINALGHSSATDILGDQKESQRDLEATRIISTLAEKETTNGREKPQYHVRKLGFGRKKSMVIHNKESNMVKDEKASSSEGGGRRRPTSKKISGATYWDGICDFEREGSINVKCKVERNKSTSSSSIITPTTATRKFHMGGFVAFTADYHGPSHHIPKHN